jgi:hypothetical protein
MGVGGMSGILAYSTPGWSTRQFTPDAGELPAATGIPRWIANASSAGRTCRLALAILALGSGTAIAGTPRANVLTRVIVRDSETMRDIRQTAATRLERGRPYRLVVIKSRYRLNVLEGERQVKVFPIALGGSPSGTKEHTQDGKTPEGEYTLVPHYASTGYGECFFICYPSEDDAARALEHGLIDIAQRNAIVAASNAHAPPPATTQLGGLILLHGTKNRGMIGLTWVNWTLGCVAMENRDLLELLSVYNVHDRPILRIEP